MSYRPLDLGMHKPFGLDAKPMALNREMGAIGFIGSHLDCHAVHWPNCRPHVLLGEVEGLTRSEAHAWNSSSLVVGFMRDDQLARAAYWELVGETVAKRELLPYRQTTPKYSAATAVNNRGQIVGLTGLSHLSETRTVLWPNCTEHYQFLNTPRDAVWSSPTGLNNYGNVSGTLHTGTIRRACVWIEERCTVLPDDGHEGWSAGINDANQICGIIRLSSGKLQPSVWEQSGTAWKRYNVGGDAYVSYVVGINTVGEVFGYDNEGFYVWPTGKKEPARVPLSAYLPDKDGTACGIADNGCLLFSWGSEKFTHRRPLVLEPWPKRAAR